MSSGARFSPRLSQPMPTSSSTAAGWRPSATTWHTRSPFQWSSWCRLCATPNRCVLNVSAITTAGVGLALVMRHVGRSERRATELLCNSRLAASHSIAVSSCCIDWLPPDAENVFFEHARFGIGGAPGRPRSCTGTSPARSHARAGCHLFLWTFVWCFQQCACLRTDMPNVLVCNHTSPLLPALPYPRVTRNLEANDRLACHCYMLDGG
jgi:hypothetical protein